MTVTDCVHFLEVIDVLVAEVLQEDVVLIDSLFLLFDTDFLSLKNSQLFTLAFDLSIAILIVFLKLGDVLVTLAHHFRIVI